MSHFVHSISSAFLPDPTLTPNLDLAHVDYRLATMGALPPSFPVSRIKAADAGFYFRGNEDEMTCYSCGISHSGWRGEENPMDVHRQLSPSCQHVQQKDRELAAIAFQSTLVTTQSTLSNRHVTGNGQSHEARERDIPEEDSESRPSSTTPSATRNSEGSEARLSSMIPVSPSDESAAARADSRQLFPNARLELGGAVYPMYLSITRRRQTFSTWDTSRAPPLDQVILSGMFYAGYADCVRCFYCGVGLKHWVATDSVWDEHVRWRPECRYLRAIKGDQFIRETQRRLGIESSTSSQGQGRPPPPGSGGNSNQQPSSVPGQRQQQPSLPNSPDRSTTNNGTAANTSAATTCQAAAAPCGATSTSSASLSNGQSDREGDGSQGAEERGHGPSVVVSNVADTLAQLQEEHQELSQQLLCKVCRCAPIDTILMPCGHLVLCKSCAGSATSCPLCLDAILTTAKVHLVE